MDNIFENAKKLSAEEYFAYVKNCKQHITSEKLNSIYENGLRLLRKCVVTKQTSLAKKLVFQLESIKKEFEIVEAGVDTFVYREDIEEYIENVAGNSVVIIELERYEREIPDEIEEIISKFGQHFTDFYVLFTDYTGKERKKVEKERRSIDPILFGTIRDKETDTMIDRFYYLGDWVDEYCDLTLDKMIAEMKRAGKKDIDHHISNPETIEELRDQVASLIKADDNAFRISNNQQGKKPEKFFDKVRTFLGFKK